MNLPVVLQIADHVVHLLEVDHGGVLCFDLGRDTVHEDQPVVRGLTGHVRRAGAVGQVFDACFQFVIAQEPVRPVPAERHLRIVTAMVPGPPMCGIGARHHLGDPVKRRGLRAPVTTRRGGARRRDVAPASPLSGHRHRVTEGALPLGLPRLGPQRRVGSRLPRREPIDVLLAAAGHRIPPDELVRRGHLVRRLARDVAALVLKVTLAGGRAGPQGFEIILAIADRPVEPHLVANQVPTQVAGQVVTSQNAVTRGNTLGDQLRREVAPLQLAAHV